MKQELISQLEALLTDEDILSKREEIKTIKKSFADLIKVEVKVVEETDSTEDAEENKEAVIVEQEIDPLDNAFEAALQDVNTKIADIQAEKKRIENDNIAKKKEIISKLNDLITKEEHIVNAFNTQKELSAEWKEIGDISREKNQQLQKEYSKLMELFFYNMRIYRELKENDLRKNEQLKEKIILQLAELTKEESIKSIEQQLNVLQNEWEDIGPTFSDKWEDIKERYWAQIRELYKRIKEHYDNLRSSMQTNLQLKLEMVEKVKAAIEETPTNHSEWESKTKEILALQNEWKGIGYAPKKEGDEVWKNYRAVCDNFFEAKREFYQDRNAKFKGVKDKKDALIERANVLKTSKEWKETTNKIINLQKEWKNLGTSGPRYEQKMWTKFRGICDEFFNAKEAFYAEQEKELEGNLAAKTEVLAEIEKFKAKGDPKEVVASLQSLTEKFNGVGDIPRANREELYGKFKSLMDDHYKAIDLSPEEKEEVLFKAKIETIGAQHNSDTLFERERNNLRTEITKLQGEITQYENNLGFFSNSKGANALLTEVQEKITKSKEKVAVLKQRLKQIPR